MSWSSLMLESQIDLLGRYQLVALLVILVWSAFCLVDSLMDIVRIVCLMVLPRLLQLAFQIWFVVWMVRFVFGCTLILLMLLPLIRRIFVCCTRCIVYRQLVQRECGIVVVFVEDMSLVVVSSWCLLVLVMVVCRFGFWRRRFWILGWFLLVLGLTGCRRRFSFLCLVLCLVALISLWCGIG